MSIQTDIDRADVDESTVAEDEAPSIRISKDDAFHILQNPRRRAVLRYFLESEEDRFVMGDIAEEVAAWEHDTTVSQLDSDQRQRVYISLYQSHLPKLDDHGVIEYDQARGTVVPTPLVQVFEPYVEDGLHAGGDLTVDGAVESREEKPSRFVTALSTLLSE